MKNISLALNIVLVVAVAVLFYLHFSNGSAVQEKNTEDTESPSAYSVAYINADTVLNRYDFFKDEQAKLENKAKKLEAEYTNRAKGLQKEVNDYQQSMNSLTIGQAKAVEENLMKKQQNLRMYQESLSQDLMKEEAKLNKALYEKVSGFISEYSKKNGFEMVVKFNQGSDIMYATEGMDITEAVITGLNNAYAAENGDAQMPKDSVLAK